MGMRVVTCQVHVQVIALTNLGCLPHLQWRCLTMACICIIRRLYMHWIKTVVVAAVAFVVRSIIYLVWAHSTRIVRWSTIVRLVRHRCPLWQSRIVFPSRYLDRFDFFVMSVWFWFCIKLSSSLLIS